MEDGASATVLPSPAGSQRVAPLTFDSPTWQDPEAEHLELLDFPDSPEPGCDRYGRFDYGLDDSDGVASDEENGADVESDASPFAHSGNLWSFADLGGAPGSESRPKRNARKQSWTRSNSDSRIDLCGKAYYFFDDEVLAGGDSATSRGGGAEAGEAVVELDLKPSFQEPGDSTENLLFPEDQDERCRNPSPLGDGAGSVFEGYTHDAVSDEDEGLFGAPSTPPTGRSTAVEFDLTQPLFQSPRAGIEGLDFPEVRVQCMNPTPKAASRGKLDDAEEWAGTSPPAFVLSATADSDADDELFEEDEETAVVTTVVELELEQPIFQDPEDGEDRIDFAKDAAGDRARNPSPPPMLEGQNIMDAIVQNPDAVGYTLAAGAESDDDQELFGAAVFQGPDEGVDRITFEEEATGHDRSRNPSPPPMAVEIGLFDDVMQNPDAVGYACSRDGESDNETELFEKVSTPVAAPLAIVSSDWCGPVHLRVQNISAKSARPDRPGNPLAKTLLGATVGSSSTTPRPTPTRAAMTVGLSPTELIATPLEAAGRAKLSFFATIAEPSPIGSVATPAEAISQSSLTKAHRDAEKHTTPALPIREDNKEMTPIAGPVKAVLVTRRTLAFAASPLAGKRP